MWGRAPLHCSCPTEPSLTGTMSNVPRDELLACCLPAGLILRKTSEGKALTMRCVLVAAGPNADQLGFLPWPPVSLRGGAKGFGGRKEEKWMSVALTEMFIKPSCAFS